MNLRKISDWIITTPSLLLGSAPIAVFSPFSHPSPSHLAPYTGNRRLGFVYQHLCSVLFQHSEYFGAVHEELQINHQGKTLGAVDFVVETSDKEWQHWEVAIKFYLLHHGYWYGPNAKDRLDKKINHMLERQLPFSHTNEFSASYPQFGKPSQHLLMQGRLYINPFEPEEIPTYCSGISINLDRVVGHWCFQHQQHLIDEPLFLLDKPQWITGKSEENQSYSMDAKGFVHCQSESGTFWFIVPDDWPNNTTA